LPSGSRPIVGDATGGKIREAGDGETEVSLGAILPGVLEQLPDRRHQKLRSNFLAALRGNDPLAAVEARRGDLTAEADVRLEIIFFGAVPKIFEDLFLLGPFPRPGGALLEGKAAENKKACRKRRRDRCCPAKFRRSRRR
jgi:hypothetical protein